VSYPKFYREELETMPPEKLKRLQEEKLEKQLDYTLSKSTFYQEKYREAGVDYKKVKYIEDLSQLPFTTKDDLRKSQEITESLLGSNQAVDDEEIIRTHASSGTTGAPLLIGLTRHDLNAWNEMVARSGWCGGLRPNDVLLMTNNYAYFVGGLGCHLGWESIGCNMIPVGVGDAERAVRTAMRLKATAWGTTASQVIYFAGVIEREFDFKPAELGIRLALCGAEPGAAIPAKRKFMEETLNTKVIDAGGLSEFSPAMWSECEYQNGQHACCQEFVAIELIDPDTGENLDIKEDAVGELVYTNLEKECQPLIRYRSKDIVTVWTEKCSCGRTSLKMRISGRSDDMLIVKGVNLFPSAVEDIIRRFMPDVTGEFAIKQETEPPMNSLPLYIEVRGGKSEAELKGLEEQIKKSMRSNLIVSPTIKFLPDGTLPRAVGKAKRVYRVFRGEALPFKE